MCGDGANDCVIIFIYFILVSNFISISWNII